MPAFLPTTSRPVAIYLGQSIRLIDTVGTVDSTGITNSLQVAIGPDPMGNYRLTLTNTTDQTATARVAPNDPVLATPVTGSYEPYSDEAQAITVAAGKSVSFNCFGPWFNCSFATAPASGSLTLSR